MPQDVKNQPIVTIGDCPCGDPTPHKRFYLGPQALTRGFFSIKEGREILANPNADQYLNAESKARLEAKLEASGLPEDFDDDQADIADLTENLACVKPDFLKKTLDDYLNDSKITEAIAKEVLARIAGMTEEKRIAAGVLALTKDDNEFEAINLDDPRGQNALIDLVDPALLSRVVTGIRERQIKRYALKGLDTLLNQLFSKDNVISTCH